jgi:hypothetical protein
MAWMNRPAAYLTKVAVSIPSRLDEQKQRIKEKAVEKWSGKGGTAENIQRLETEAETPGEGCLGNKSTRTV